MIETYKIHIAALQVIRELQAHGFEAYLVGGAVRDLIIGKKPKDYDVVTNATNSQIARLFKKCELIGRRFPIALVREGQEIIEVSTYVSDEPFLGKDGQANRKKGADRTPGTIKTDSAHRDFTINALYFNPQNEQLIDLQNGLEDLKNHQLRFIGNAEEKIIEDPIRMVRAIRQSFQLNLQILPEDQTLFQQHAYRINNSSKYRLVDEIRKILRCGYSFPVLQELIFLRAFDKRLPKLYTFMSNELPSSDKVNMRKVLTAIDQFAQTAEKLTDHIFFAALMLPLVCREFELYSPSNDNLSEQLMVWLDNAGKDLWIELSLERWKKKAILQAYSLQQYFVFGENEFIKKDFAYRKDFSDGFDLFRLYSNISQQYSEYVEFWDYVEKNPNKQDYLLNVFWGERDYLNHNLLTVLSRHKKEFTRVRGEKWSKKKWKRRK